MTAATAPALPYPLPDLDGQAPVTSAGFIHDFAPEGTAGASGIERRHVEIEPYRGLAYRDALTGLWNRRMFEERLAAEIGRPSHTLLRRFSILLVDMNDLGRINQRHGHAVGDRVLSRVAGLLVANLRPEDVCCRVGGDEFAAILPDASGLDAQSVVGRLRRALVACNARSTPAVGMSVGAATFPSDGRSASALFRQADARMYEDKRRGDGDAGLRAAG